MAGSLQTGDRRVRARLGLRHGTPLASLTSPSYLVRNRTLGPPLENNPEIPPSSRDEGLRLLHGLATNLASWPCGSLLLFGTWSFSSVLLAPDMEPQGSLRTSNIHTSAESYFELNIIPFGTLLLLKPTSSLGTVFLMYLIVNCKKTA